VSSHIHGWQSQLSPNTYRKWWFSAQGKVGHFSSIENISFYITGVDQMDPEGRPLLVLSCLGLSGNPS
jgi:hypothetical protein